MPDSSEEIVKAFGNRLRLRVCGVCLQNDRILMVKHRYLGQEGYLWAPPGGGMQVGESAETTLVREFREETGLGVEVGSFLFVNEFLRMPLHAIELFFETKITGGTLITGQDPEMNEGNQLIEEVCFLSIAELNQEKKGQIHADFRNIENISVILSKSGYSLSKD